MPSPYPVFFSVVLMLSLGCASRSGELGRAARSAMDQKDVPAWSVTTFDDEAGFQRRIHPTIPALAQQSVGVRSLAASRCPDTDLPVRVWAVEGETIISPYTGRAYIQGPTGYFGPKARNEDGEITAFGGDPLKYDLPPAQARLMLDPDDQQVRAFLSIPGNLNQQYHFAAVNWCRLYPVFAEKLGEEWQQRFAQAVAEYREKRRPSDGEREHAPMASAHDLVGEPGELLGGGVEDGGTENHKTMNRTSGLLYAQLLGDEAKISGYPAPEARNIITEMIRHYLDMLLRTGSGEYDSSTYYPYSIRGFLNLYDFSPDPATRDMARFALDYYLATYGLKVFNGYHTGAQKRGFTSGFGMAEMEALLWAYLPKGTTSMESPPILTIQQATTDYRPNRVISNIITKNVELPFEAFIARPTYHLRDHNAFQETFYCSHAFAMGSIAMTMVDNPTQQTVWSLNIRDRDGSRIVGGGQPRFRSPEGHSPYDQVIQKRSALILVTGQTGPRPEGELDSQQRQRYRHAERELEHLPLDAPVRERIERGPNLAESWLYLPRDVQYTRRGDWIGLRIGDAYVAVRPLGSGGAAFIDPPEESDDRRLRNLGRYIVLVSPGDRTGFVVDVADRREHRSMAAFLREVENRTSLNLDAFQEQGVVRYTSLAGDELEMRYQPTRLRAEGTINGEPIDWSHWAGGGVYKSPYIQIADGLMYVTDGREAYEVRITGTGPVYEAAEVR
ncbi:MAG: hypothetical protein JJU36_06260 [Phycisphaeraceae bacterium]|nr:hypothetical protein [Phycisphaeraceae bacterium]